MEENILLFTSDYASAKSEVEGLGGRITQHFTERVFVAALPGGVDPTSLTASTPEQPDGLDEMSQIMAEAWVGFTDRPFGASASPDEGVSWDDPDHEAPVSLVDVDGDIEPSPSADGDPQLSTGTPTSEYMVGSIAVGVIVVDGTAPEFAMSTAERTQIVQEVQEGLNFLASAEPRANVTFVYDVQFRTVSAAPGSTATYESAEAPWRNEALGQMGFSANRQGSIDYVNNLRQSKGTDWAYVAYFTKYPLKHFAYAVSEKTTMHFDNDGWGTASINRVFAHETCHIFGAADEYGSCGCGGSHGYLGIPNNNCKNCAGTQLDCLMSGNVLEMCEWSRKQIGWDEQLFPGVPTALSGSYTLKQKSSGRFADAHEASSKDFSVVTRTAQNNDTQRWILTQVGQVCTVEQKSSGRFLDAHEASAQDFSVVTRTAQDNDTQRWVLMADPDRIGTYTMQQLNSGRFADAHEASSRDFSVVTRSAQNNDTQRWAFSRAGTDAYTIQQVSNDRFLDAHEDSTNDFSVVTRTAQDNDTQRWVLQPVAGVYTIQQKSNGRLFDAHEASSHDFSVVTRVTQNNDTQRWILTPLGNDTHTMQQLSNGRFLDAHEASSNDFSVVTRTAQDNDTQRWIIER